MTDGWSEDNSAVYRQLAQVAVPARAEQMAALLTLIPFTPDAAFKGVELASGEGRLADALLSLFPKATLTALDGSESMRAATAQRLARHGGRGTVAAFEMAKSDWYDHLSGADVVLSSLCVHHLTGDEKRALFTAVAGRLTAHGALLIADIIKPKRGEGRELFAATWEASVAVQSRALAGDDSLARLFDSEDWNWYRYPDAFDKPSTLFDQLHWLHQSGFRAADVFWMQAGHAVYGGYKAEGDFDGPRGATYADALKAARAALGE